MVQFNCTWIAGRFVLLPLFYWSTVKRDVSDMVEIERQQADYIARLQYSGVSAGNNPSSRYCS